MRLDLSKGADRMIEQADERAPERGAVEELARDPASRARFLKMVGGTGAAGAFALFLAACGSSSSKSTSSSASSSAPSSSQFGSGDLGIVKYALTLEYLEADFYTKAAASGKLSGAALKLGKEFGAEEMQHVTALEATVKKLGGQLPPKPKTNFPLADQGSILKLAGTVENLGAAAYLGQATNIQSKEVLAAALSIHTVEGRHASALNTVLGKDVTPDGAFAKPADMTTVLAAVKPFIVS
jgi:rubrerythrin